MAVRYKDWLSAVERLLAQRRPDVRISHLDPNFLYGCFQEGMSPMEFVLSGQFQLKPVAQPPAKPSPGGANKTLWALLIIVGATFAAFGSCVILAALPGPSISTETAAAPLCSEIQSALTIGMTPDQVLEAIGKPAKVQEMNSYGSSTGYWYYNCQGGVVQVVFEQGMVVVGINRY